MAFIGNTPISVAFLTDTFSGNGSTTAFTMTVAPANTSSIIVAVTGVLQDPSTYAVSGTTLTFSAAPPTGTSNISVRYLGIPASGVTTTAYRTVTNFTATAGQTSFSVPSYTIGYIDVYRNGVRLVSTDYTATTGTTVVLNNACTVGDAVVTESFYVSSVLNAIPATAASVQQTYLASGVAGTGPAFSAYQSSTQTLSSATLTKIQFQTEEFDTNSCFDSTTNYRFTPNVAGYYLVSGHVQPDASYTAGIQAIYKNGSVYKYGSYNANATGVSQPSVTCLVYLNGSTDYVEFYGSFTTGQATVATSAFTWFQGHMARAA
jgi:hypothetical protein